jgi:Flp pilus assembly protein TadG
MRALVELAVFARNFFRQKKGNVATIFALSLLPLLTATGAAVDYSRAVKVRSHLLQALDAAGLAAGAATGLNQTQLTALAQNYFNANFPSTELGVPGTLKLTLDGNKLTLSAAATLDTAVMHVLGVDSLTVNENIEIMRGAMNIEVGLALDATGSMGGTKISDLRAAAKELIDIVVQDSQTPYYSKVALVPYSMAVNVGSYASQIRGPVTDTKSITGASWSTGSTKNITNITKANPAVVTSNGHGFVNGNRIYITNVSGMTNVNGNSYTVSGVTTNTFQLSGTNSSGYKTYKSGGTAIKCQNSDCSIVITSSNHGFSNDDLIYISGVIGMTELNNNFFTVASKTTNDFALSGTWGPDYSTYISGGKIYCTEEGCEYFNFTSASGSSKTFKITTCVTERTTDAFTDVAPSTTYLGRNYRDPSSSCISGQIVPLSSDKTYLKNQIGALAAGGSTAGHIGVAWAWYMVSPDFAYLWPSGSKPAAYNTEELTKVVVLMTDGLFNSPYCKGVIAKDATSGSGSSSEHINCNAPNKDAYYQAKQLCDEMRKKNVVVYTVGFDIGDDDKALDLMNYCAKDEDYVYLASDGAELTEAFKAIGQGISNLRVSK